MRDQPRRETAHGKKPRAQFVRKPPVSPLDKAAKGIRGRKHASPVKRTYNGKATTSVGIASSLDRSYRAFVKFESRARWLESAIGSGKLKDGLEGDEQQLQEELDQCRLRGELLLRRSRAAETAIKKGRVRKG
jgi:hypothetical protein